MLALCQLGARFGHWTVVGARFYRGTNIRYPCRCVCGEIRSVSVASLMERRSQSCGDCQPRFGPKARLTEREVHEILRFPWTQTYRPYDMWRARVGLTAKSIRRIRQGLVYRPWFESFHQQRSAA